MGTEAVNEYKILAQQARENELYDDAKAFYRKVISLSPTEHQIQKRLFEMLRLKSDPDTCKEGLVLAAILDQVGMLAEEVDALRLISGICPGDAAIRERTGALEASLGDQKSAFESYETAAELCLRSGDIQHACALYEKALENRPGDARVTSKIEELKSGLFLANREKRKKTVRLAIYSVAAALVLLFIAYQGISVSSYCTMRNKNLIFLTAGDPETACENTAHWERRFPLSLIRLDARRYVRIVRELQHAQITTQPDAFSPSVPAVEDSPGSASAPAATLAPDSMAPDQTRDSTTD
jgi:tetratricopeptide (TPR) repeat protein